MAKYCKKPVVVEVSEPWLKQGDHPDVRPYSDEFDDGDYCDCDNCYEMLSTHGIIGTLEGEHLVCPGDRIVTGVKGEKYPIKPDIFEETY